MLTVKIPKDNIVFRQLQLKKINFIICFQTKEQCYSIDLQYTVIVSRKKFQKQIKKSLVYTFISTFAAISILLELSLKYTNYTNIFSEKEANCLSDKNAKQHSINLIDKQEPLYRLIYNLSKKKLKVLQKYLETSLQNSWIQQSSSSASTLILFVSKKNRSFQLCIDYCNLNKITIKNCYLLLLISKTLNKLQRAKKYTKLDLYNIYYQI